jgi:anti-sigma B factor antagonist
MQIETRTAGPVVIVDVSGRLVLSEPGSDKQLKDCIAELIATGARRVIVNVAGVTDVDTSGLSALVYTHITMARSGAHLKLTALTPRLRHLLHVTRLDAVFNICDSEKQALAEFSAP